MRLRCWEAMATVVGRRLYIYRTRDIRLRLSTTFAAGSGHELGVQTSRRFVTFGSSPDLQDSPKYHSALCRDVMEYDFLSDVIRDFEPEAVVHFAEQRALRIP